MVCASCPQQSFASPQFASLAAVCPGVSRCACCSVCNWHGRKICRVCKAFCPPAVRLLSEQEECEMSELKGKRVVLESFDKSLTAAFVVSEVVPKSHVKVQSQAQTSRAQSDDCNVQSTKEEFCELIAGNVQLKGEFAWQYSLIKEMGSLASAAKVHWACNSCSFSSTARSSSREGTGT